ncbi:hypothetical protein D9M71_717270 [compost metagenome]
MFRLLIIGQACRVLVTRGFKIYAKEISGACQQLAECLEVLWFFDLHVHPSQKPSFIRSGVEELNELLARRYACVPPCQV